MKAPLKNGLFMHIIGQNLVCMLSFVILFICMIGHILHLYFETRYSFYTLLNLKLNLVKCRNDSRKASTLLLDTRSLAVDVVVGLLIFRKIKSLV